MTKSGFDGVTRTALIRLVVWLALLLGPAAVGADKATDNEPPVIPVGLDAYRMWDRWPYQRIGARAYMRSTLSPIGFTFMSYLTFFW